jgi:hypothetical protein
MVSICYFETMEEIKYNKRLKHLEFDCYMNADCHQILTASALLIVRLVQSANSPTAHFGVKSKRTAAGVTIIACVF